MEINKIYQEDCRFGIEKIDIEIGLTLTSPPYFGYSDNYTENKKDYIQEERDFNKYINYLKEIFKKIYDKTREGGFCVLIYGDYGHKTKPYNEICYVSKICDMMQEIGWRLIAQRIWHKKINPLALNIINFQSSLSGRYRTTKGFEYILSFYKGELSVNNEKLFFKGTEIKDYFKNSDLTLQEFKEWVPNSVWRINEKHPYDAYLNAKKTHNHTYRRIHPFQLPLALLNRLIKIYSNKDDLVLDPFAGSGTTLIACEYLKRKYIGFELEQKFVKYFEDVRFKVKSESI
jgi:site-specific DNA-methyltransferase (adenine-specific)